MKCANCGALVDDGLDTCPECGMPLVEPAQGGEKTEAQDAQADAEASPEDEAIGNDDAPVEGEAVVEEDAPVEDEASIEDEVADDEAPSLDNTKEVHVREKASVEEPQVTPVQAPFDATPEPFVVLTSSAMNSIQQRCPHCGAVVYSGMRRCSRCGRRLIGEEPEDTEGAIKAAPLREYRRFIGNGGAILLILLVLAGGYFVARLVPRLITPLFNDSPTIVGGESIDHEITEFMAEGEEEPEPEPEPEPTKANAQNFPTRWQGTYEGAAYSDGTGTITCGILFTLDSVNEDGSITGTCEAGFGDFDPNNVDASYKLAGNVNWETGEIHLQGTEWNFSGEIERMRQFNGTVNFDAGTISGSAAGTDGSNERSWQMTAL